MCQSSATKPNVWPVWGLAMLLYVFAASGVAVNLFMLGLMLQTFGLAPFSPVQSVVLSVPLGVPAAWATGQWVRRLLDEATD